VKRWWFFLGLLAIAGLLLAYFLISLGSHSRETPAVATTTTALEDWNGTKLLFQSREAFTSFILNRKSNRIKIRKEEDGWNIASPIRGAVRKQFIIDFSKRLHEVILQRSFPASSDSLNQYGLSEPPYEIELTTNLHTEVRVLQVGRTAADGQSTYVRWKNENRIFLMQGSLSQLFSTALEDIRTPHLFSVPSEEVMGFERKTKSGDWTASLYGHQWYLHQPKEIRLHRKRMDHYVRRWAQLEIQAYSWETGLPEVGEENEIILLTRNRKFSCRIGELDPLKGSYPLVCPEESIEVWVAAKNLEPLIETPYQDLIPRLISETPFPLLGRIEVTLGSGKLTFFRKNDVWFRQENRTDPQVFARTNTWDF